jgi:hypothetical protein
MSTMNSRRLMGFAPLAENYLLEILIRSSSESYAPHRSKTGRCQLGQKWTLSRARARSVDPLVTDMQGLPRHVRFARSRPNTTIIFGEVS